MTSRTDQTVAAYDQYSELYDQEVAEFWEKFPRATVKAFCGRLPGKRVLDLGSGSGRDALILRAQGLEVTCLDASAKMVEMTRGLGFESRQAQFAEMKLPEAGFDGVWAYTSIIHVAPDEAARVVQKLARALKPGGAFLLGVILGEGAGMVERKTMPGAQRYFKRYSREELGALVLPQGFTLAYEEEYRPRNSAYLSQVYIRTRLG